MPQDRRIRLSEPTFDGGDRAAVAALFRGGRLTQGENVRGFEKEFGAWNSLGPSQRCMMVNSGSSANLLMAEWLARYRAPDTGRREIIMPALTWSTAVAPFIQRGFTPVFVDVGHDYILSPRAVEEAISERTCAILAVHLLGNPCNMDELVRLADQSHVVLLEDCCEALGARWGNRTVGTFGKMASWSFYFSHHLNAIEGGMLASPAGFTVPLALREHGWIREYPEANRNQIAMENPELDPRWIFDELGYNLRSTEVNALLARRGLRLQSWAGDKRRSVAGWYRENLVSDPRVLDHPSLDGRALPNPFSYPLRVALPDGAAGRLRGHLEADDIETRPIMSGDIRLHPWFSANRSRWRTASDMPNTVDAHKRGLLLPCHPKLHPAQLQRIRRSIDAFLKAETGVGLS